MNSKSARTIFDKSDNGKTGYVLPKLDLDKILTVLKRRKAA